MARTRSAAAGESPARMAGPRSPWTSKTTVGRPPEIRRRASSARKELLPDPEAPTTTAWRSSTASSIGRATDGATASRAAESGASRNGRPRGPRRFPSSRRAAFPSSPGPSGPRPSSRTRRAVGPGRSTRGRRSMARSTGRPRRAAGPGRRATSSPSTTSGTGRRSPGRPPRSAWTPRERACPPARGVDRGRGGRGTRLGRSDRRPRRPPAVRRSAIGGRTGPVRAPPPGAGEAPKGLERPRETIGGVSDGEAERRNGGDDRRKPVANPFEQERLAGGSGAELLRETQ